jgi:cyanate permease
MVLLLNVHSLVTGYAFAFYFGIVFGTTFTMNDMIYASYFGRFSLGAIRGLASPIQLVFNATGPFLAGLVSDVSGSYRAAFLGFIVLYGIAVTCALAAPQPARRPVAAPPSAAVA